MTATSPFIAVLESSIYIDYTNRAVGTADAALQSSKRGIEKYSKGATLHLATNNDACTQSDLTILKWRNAP